MQPLITWKPPSQQAPSLPDMETFIQNLRTFSKKSIIDIGTAQLWNAHKNPENRQNHFEYYHLLNAYAPRIVMLGMATASVSRNKNVSHDQFFGLCQDYLGIGDTIGDKDFLDQETTQIVSLLKGIIPDQYLQFDHVRQSCTELFVARLVRSQHESYKANFQEFLRAYRIFQHLDQEVDATGICKTIFNIEPIHFLRSGFMLFALGNNSGKNGKIAFGSLTCEQAVIDNLQIDPDTCQLVASKISYNESDLRGWYEQGVLGVHQKYQKYFPDPLHRHPLIHRDDGEQDVNFLIPAPALFVRGFVNSLFSQMFAFQEGLDVTFGDAIEKTIMGSLVQIFGQDNVTKIEGDAERADFYVHLPQCDLIIEAKTTLGGYQAQSIMSPEDISKLWARLYKASSQCAASILEYKQDSRPIIGIVLVADHGTAESMPFQTFAERSGLYADLGIEGVEYLSWNAVENTLSHTSIEKFEAALLKKWEDGKRMTVGDVITFEMERDAPAHHYEHLQDVEIQIFGKTVLKE